MSRHAPAALPGLRLLGLALGVLLGGCAESGAAPAEPPRGVITGGAASLEELADGVVGGLVEGDTAALAGYRVTEHEHNELLWPEFPIARQDPPFPVDLAWENLEVQNAGALHRLLPRFAGRAVRLDSVECPGGEEAYPSFTVLHDCRIWLVEAGGRRRVTQPFKSVVVRDGHFKVVRYRHD